MNSSILHHFIPSGKYDLIGDIHGEWTALCSLLDRLGYRDGIHPSGRKLIFLGDLVDRGPQSPSVLRFVSELVSNQLAYCLLGNHELHLLHHSLKDGNAWFFNVSHQSLDQRYQPYEICSPQDRTLFLQFLSSLPLFLESPEFRVVHASWHLPSINLLTTLQSQFSNILDLDRYFSYSIEEAIEHSGLRDYSERERILYDHLLYDPHQSPPFLDFIAEVNLLRQMQNPVRIAVSGPETYASIPFFSGEWRFVQRQPWWNFYFDLKPVFIGHYWRTPNPYPLVSSPSSQDQRFFDHLSMSDWHGHHRNVFCLDFSVGARYRERQSPSNQPQTQLAAYRWPEHQIVFDRHPSLLTYPPNS